jgi:branched-chain amino acid transport system ATP-binding protein
MMSNSEPLIAFLVAADAAAARQAGCFFSMFRECGSQCCAETLDTRHGRLHERREQQADTLSGGERQMLAISRAYMARPQLLLLDEPSLGLAPLVIEQIFQSIRHIVDSMGVTVVLVEQNAMGALRIADFGVVLNLGSIAAWGRASDLTADPAVRTAYLGF